MKISGNGWVVTGGLGGLGRVIATSLLAEGGSVVVSLHAVKSLATQ